MVEMGHFGFELIEQRFAAMVGYRKKMGGASLNERIAIGLAVELSPTSYLEPKANKHDLLQGGCSDSRISSLRSTGGGMYRDGGSGGRGGDDDGSNGDGIGGGDECADGAVHLARRSLTEGGDSEVSGDGGRVGMARSLSISASGGKDIKA
ncbi:hypothetical protein Tco_0934391 [Tanacetum coccineum]